MTLYKIKKWGENTRETPQHEVFLEHLLGSLIVMESCSSATGPAQVTSYMHEWIKSPLQLS